MFDNTSVVYLLLKLVLKLVFCISNDILTFLGQTNKLRRQAENYGLKPQQQHKEYPFVLINPPNTFEPLTWFP